MEDRFKIPILIIAAGCLFLLLFLVGYEKEPAPHYSKWLEESRSYRSPVEVQIGPNKVRFVELGITEIGSTLRIFGELDEPWQGEAFISRLSDRENGATSGRSWFGFANDDGTAIYLELRNYPLAASEFHIRGSLYSRGNYSDVQFSVANILKKRPQRPSGEITSLPLKKTQRGLTLKLDELANISIYTKEKDTGAKAVLTATYDGKPVTDWRLIESTCHAATGGSINCSLNPLNEPGKWGAHFESRLWPCEGVWTLKLRAVNTGSAMPLELVRFTTPPVGESLNLQNSPGEPVCFVNAESSKRQVTLTHRFAKRPSPSWGHVLSVRDVRTGESVRGYNDLLFRSWESRRPVFYINPVSPGTELEIRMNWVNEYIEFELPFLVDESSDVTEFAK